MKNHLPWDPEDLDQALAVLKQGGTILYPTDTVWGLGADAENGAAVQKVFDIKERPPQKSMIILIADWDAFNRYLSSPPAGIKEIILSQQRPLTLILDGARSLPSNLIGSDGTLGIRYTHDPFCRSLIHELGRPLVSSSANVSGDPTPLHFQEISSRIQTQVDYLVRFRQEDETPRLPSQIWRMYPDGTHRVIRP